MANPLLIIPSFISKKEHAHVLIKCVSTLRASTDAEVLIVDDCSPATNISNLYSEIKDRYDQIEVYEKDENTGFAQTVNVGLIRALSDRRDACLINQDIEFVNDNWLEEMEKTDAAIVGALLLYPSYIIQSAGTYFSKITRQFVHRFVGSAPNLPAAQIPCECPVTAALQYIRYEVMEEVGVYDGEFLLGFEDVDYLIRTLQGGYKSIYNPDVRALHHESLVRRDKSPKVREWEGKSLLRLMEKHKDVNFAELAIPTMLEERTYVEANI